MDQPTVIDCEPHLPTEESREEVAAMVAMGLSALEVALVLRADPTVVKHAYADEIASGEKLATAKVGGALYRKAVSGDVKAATFWLQARAGWRTGAQAVQPVDAPGNSKSDLVGRILGMLTPAQLVAAVQADAPPATPPPASVGGLH